MTDSTFELFWNAYPHKVGKKAAEKKYWIVRREVDHDTIMHGLALYKETKPDWKAWCNPATWLNQGRWEDQPADTRPPDPGERASPALPPCYQREFKPKAKKSDRLKLRLEAQAVMRKRGEEPLYAKPERIEEVMRELAGRNHEAESRLTDRQAQGGQ